MNALIKTLRLKIKEFKKTKAYKYYQNYIEKQIALGHNEKGIPFRPIRYSNI
jgi:hypothetical protein